MAMGMSGVWGKGQGVIELYQSSKGNKNSPTTTLLHNVNGFMLIAYQLRTKYCGNWGNPTWGNPNIESLIQSIVYISI